MFSSHLRLDGLFESGSQLFDLLRVDSAAAADNGNTLFGDPFLGKFGELVSLLLGLARPGVGVKREDLAAIRVDQTLGDLRACGQLSDLAVDGVEQGRDGVARNAVDAERPEHRMTEVGREAWHDFSDGLAMTDSDAVAAAHKGDEERLPVELAEVFGHGDALVDARDRLNANNVDIGVVQECVESGSVEIDVGLLSFLGRFERVDPGIFASVGRTVSLSLSVRPAGSNDEAGLVVALVSGLLGDGDSEVDGVSEELDVISIAVDVCAVSACDGCLGSGLEVVLVRVHDDARVRVEDLRRPLGVVQVTTVLLFHLGGEAAIEDEGLVRCQECLFGRR